MIKELPKYGVGIITLKDGERLAELYMDLGWKEMDRKAPGWDPRLKSLSKKEALKK